MPATTGLTGTQCDLGRAVFGESGRHLVTVFRRCIHQQSACYHTNKEYGCQDHQQVRFALDHHNLSPSKLQNDIDENAPCQFVIVPLTNSVCTARRSMRLYARPVSDAILTS